MPVNRAGGKWATLVLIVGGSELENKECALDKKGIWGLQPFVIRKIVEAKQQMIIDT